MKNPELKTKTITVKTNEVNPEPLELVAKSIIQIAETFEKMKSSPLRQHTVIIILKDMTGLSQRDIKAVLEAAADLKRYALK